MLKTNFFAMILLYLFLSNNSSAMDISYDNQPTFQKIFQSMNILKENGLHKECHVNIFRLAEHLKNLLTQEELNQIRIMIIKPHKKNRNEKYLPNSPWFHHVVLVLGSQVFDFFTERESEESVLDYLYENFFNLLKPYQLNIGNLVYSSYNRYYFSGFNSFSLIDKNIGIQSLQVSIDDYLNCIKETALLFTELLTQPSLFEINYFYDRRVFLTWYKKRHKGIIAEIDTFYLWDDLYQLQYEVLNSSKSNNESMLNTASEVTDSFNWPELNVMVRRWENKELTIPIYMQILKSAQPL